MKPSHHIRHTTKMMGFALAITLSACATPVTPAEHVIYQPVNVEVPRPCPVAKPTRPAPLAKPLPADPGALVSLLVAKLLEWAGPGGYGERAEAAIDTCTKANPPPS